MDQETEAKREADETKREAAEDKREAAENKKLAATQSPREARTDQGDWAKSNNPSPDEQIAEGARTAAVKATELQGPETDPEINREPEYAANREISREPYTGNREANREVFETNREAVEDEREA